MATDAQVQANRLNAQKSTGPASAEGKAKSCLNAIKHAMDCMKPESLAMLEGGKDVVRIRTEKLAAEFRPEGEFQHQLLDMIVMESIKLERIRCQFFAMIERLKLRADGLWGEDRSTEAAELIERIHRYPVSVSKQLATSLAGCELLIAFWKSLLSTLTKRKTWTDEQRHLALDMLGFHPQTRDGETPLDPLEGDMLQARIDACNAEINRLAFLIDVEYVHLDKYNQEMAKVGTGLEFMSEFRLLKRHEREATSRYRWALGKLEQAKKGELFSDPPPKTRKRLPDLPKIEEAEEDRETFQIPQPVKQQPDESDDVEPFDDAYIKRLRTYFLATGQIDRLASLEASLAGEPIADTPDPEDERAPQPAPACGMSRQQRRKLAHKLKMQQKQKVKA